MESFKISGSSKPGGGSSERNRLGLGGESDDQSRRLLESENHSKNRIVQSISPISRPPNSDDNHSKLPKQLQQQQRSTSIGTGSDSTRNQHNLHGDRRFSPPLSSAEMAANLNIRDNPIDTDSPYPLYPAGAGAARGVNQISRPTATTVQLNDDGHCSTFVRRGTDEAGIQMLPPAPSSFGGGSGDDRKELAITHQKKKGRRSSTPASLNNIELHTKDRRSSLGQSAPPHDEDDTTMVELNPVEPDRETWSQGLDFLLSIIGFAVDLANVWRFPYYCYKNGGGAFLIPYFSMLFLCAIPVFYMELLLGQSIRQGPISVWKICPLFKGIGYCAVTVSYFVSFYYNTIMGWSLHYTINSFSTPLPWTTCNNSWNTDNCYIPPIHNDEDDDIIDGVSTTTLNPSTNPPASADLLTFRNLSSMPPTRPANATSPASEYFRNSVLEMGNSDIENLGSLKFDLVACVAIIYCLLYLILFRGIRSTGKVVWFTATLPYVVLAILLVRGLLLEGAYDGIYYYLVPNMTKLNEVEVWSDAAKQIFFSSGAGFGVHLTYASYNNFHNNCFRDCIVTSFVNCFTSLFSGFVIFTFLGSMATSQRRPIEEVVNIGPGLVFEVYPEAVGSLPGANFWSLLFFLMLIMLGIDSAMGGLECVVTGITDEFKNVFKHKKHSREWFMVGIVVVSFLISLVNVTRGGMYTFTFFDTYAAGSSLLLAVLFEVLVVSWVYGLDQLCADAERMLGSPPGLYWRICWKFISPLFIAIIIIMDLWTALPIKYDEYTYPDWAQIFGYIFTFIPIMLVPVIALTEFFRFPGSCKQKLAYSITPENEHPIIKDTNHVKRFELPHWLYIR